MPEPATVRRRIAPPHPRRVSGPARPRAVAAGAATLPGRTGAFERLRALPDTRAVDRLIRSRACIWLIGVMLGGIVAMQVSLLRLNTGISRAVETESTLVRQNADLEAAIGRLTAGDRVRAAAIDDDMLDPPAGETRFLVARPGTDPWLAVRRMKPPSDTARAVMANGGRLPGVSAVGAAGTLAAGTAGVTQTVPGTTAATQLSAPSATVTATAATATATPAPTATAIPTPTQTVVPTATPTPAATTAAVAAPQG
jgi:hypothetical protein